jgi:hypothetical protein
MHLPTATVVGAVMVGTLLASACSDSAGSGRSTDTAAIAIPQPTPEELAAAGLDELPVAPDGDRVDLTAPTFSHPTDVTNPLFPISDLQSAVLSGHVEGLPFHTETTLLQPTRIIEWTEGQPIEALISQYFSYLDGRIEEVALDYYAQADDGSVWYLGEDVYDYDDQGFSDSTEGTWLAGRDGPMAMIMPGSPQVGDVFRTENVPGLAFEEVTVSSVGETVDGPLGPVDGAMVGTELHDDGTRSDKVFAPGYGEFYSAEGAHRADVEAMALAVPTDAEDGPVPAPLDDLSSGADDLYQAVRAGDWRAASTAAAAVASAWQTYRSEDPPPRLAHEMTTAVDDSTEAVEARDPARAGTAAIDVAQSALDLQLRYRPQTEIDAARFDLWARQIVVDAAAEDLGGMRGDVTTMEWVLDRFAHTIDAADRVALDVHLLELREMVNDVDFGAAAHEAELTRQTLADAATA